MRKCALALLESILQEWPLLTWITLPIIIGGGQCSRSSVILSGHFRNNSEIILIQEDKQNLLCSYSFGLLRFRANTVIHPVTNNKPPNSLPNSTASFFTVITFQKESYSNYSSLIKKSIPINKLLSNTTSPQISGIDDGWADQWAEGNDCGDGVTNNPTKRSWIVPLNQSTQEQESCH